MRYLIILLLAFFSLDLAATHNRAGEITYQQIGPLTIRMTITTYTKESSSGADRDSLEVSWGDGITSWVLRSNGKGKILENDIKLNTYIQEHTYPGRSSYTITFTDPNRSGNILNINYPRSDDVKFFLSTRLTLLDLQFQGGNSSAQLLQPPIDIACVGQPFIHNPNAYDVDGDSISYELIVPLQGEGDKVPNYFSPDQIIPGPLNQIYLNPVTGDFIWQNPPQQGEYNIAMRINEWRDGVLINSIVRDMQILVKNCQSRPPIIKTQDEICVVAGTTINIPIEVSELDLNQKVKLSVTGGPFGFVNDKAVLISQSGFVKPILKANLVWKTNCNHIAKEYYQIVIRAVDNSISDTSGLATLKTIKIKVVGPKPENVTAKSTNDVDIKVEWESPYICEKALDDYFYGFSIWRKTQSVDLPIDTCNLASLKNVYTRIVFNTKQQLDGKYFIIDKDLKPNTTYCYRILPEFALKTASGNPFKKVEGIYSDEVCIQLRRDIPLLTKVSVEKTDLANGQMKIKWTKPVIPDFDTIKYSGPYKTELYRTTLGNNDFKIVPLATKISNKFSIWFDTMFVDNNLNTAEITYDYKLKFYYKNDTEYRPIPDASSVHLTIEPTDKQNKLTFTYITPWANKSFKIYRKNSSNNFVAIGTALRNFFSDTNLENGENYCYKVEALGTYSIPNIENPLSNFSQETCSKPIDNVPPCPPILEVATICDKGILSATDAVNELNFDNDFKCTQFDDVAKYNIYFKTSVSDKPILIATKDFNDKSYSHQPDTNSIAGCYFVTALDKNNNESKPSNEICIDNCPVYELPNTFTPNQDGANDIYKPMKNFFIQSIDFKLFNEWGNKIFETNNPQINWTAKTKNGNEVAQGTYYYTYVLTTKKASGNENSNLVKGYINVLR